MGLVGVNVVVEQLDLPNTAASILLFGIHEEI